MSKRHDGGPAGNRQDREHARDGWQEGGRQEDEAPFDQNEANARAERYAERHRDSDQK